MTHYHTSIVFLKEKVGSSSRKEEEKKKKEQLPKNPFRPVDQSENEISEIKNGKKSVWVTCFLLGTEGCSVLGSPPVPTPLPTGGSRRERPLHGSLNPPGFLLIFLVLLFLRPFLFLMGQTSLPSPPLWQGARPPCERCAPLRLAHLCRGIAGTRRKRALSSPRGGCEDKNTKCSWAPSRAAAFSWRLGRERLALTWKFYFSWSKSCSRLLSGLQRVTELF